MRKFTTLFITGVLILGSTGIAQAATIYTPILTAEAGNAFFNCRALNVSRRTREVTVEIVSGLGDVLAANSFQVDPGTWLGVTSGDTARSYCRVTVRGGKNTVRVSLESRIVNAPLVAVVVGQ